MSEWSERSLDCNCLGRRHFLKMATAASVVGINGAAFFLTDSARADQGAPR